MKDFAADRTKTLNKEETSPAPQSAPAVALLLSGGVGSRLRRSMPKQYLEVNGQMIVTACLQKFLTHPQIGAVQIVADAAWRERILDAAGKLAGAEKIRGFSEPGETRQLSIRNGLRDLHAQHTKDDAVVVVHDAVRPLVSRALISACIEACRTHEGAMPVLPLKDTVYYSADRKRVDRLLDRSRIYAGQAPEAFRFGKYLAANEALSRTRMLAVNGATEPAVLAGMDILMIAGEERNFKITTGEDLLRYTEIAASGTDQG